MRHVFRHIPVLNIVFAGHIRRDLTCKYYIGLNLYQYHEFRYAHILKHMHFFFENKFWLEETYDPDFVLTSLSFQSAQKGQLIFIS